MHLFVKIFHPKNRDLIVIYRQKNHFLICEAPSITVYFWKQAGTEHFVIVIVLFPLEFQDTPNRRAITHSIRETFLDARV